MRDMVQLEYNERMQIPINEPKQGEKIIEIGEVDLLLTSDYKDDREKFIHNVASSYINKGDEDE